MARGGLIVLALALAACSPGAGSSASTTTSVSSAAAPSGPCIDRGRLADSGESVGVALQGIVVALKAGNADQARSLASTAASGLRNLADFVGPLQPDAGKGFGSAADKLEGAAKSFPDGIPTVEQVQADVETAYALARTIACPE